MNSSFLSLLLPGALVVTLVSLLASCATTEKFDTTLVDKALTPQSVIAEPALSLNKIALWGGTILDTRNLKDSTQIEMLAYPLDSSHQPLRDKKPLGRFIIKHPGYLEPTSYEQGRQLTVLGSVNETLTGKIGESLYTYAVISAQKLYLWSKDDGQNKSSFHFGIGIGISR